MKNIPSNIATKICKIISALLIGFILCISNQLIFAQTIIKPRGNSPQEDQIKRELEDLKQIVLQKIENDTTRTAEAFANSKNILRSLQAAYSFETVLDTINDTFSIFGLPGDVIDVVSAKTLSQQAANSSLTFGSVMLVWENLKEDSGKLALVFNSKQYVENVRQMLKEAGSTQPVPVIEFDSNRYTEGIKFQLGTSRGQEILTVNHLRIKDSCQTIKPRGEINEQLMPFKGTNEVRHYLIDVFKKLGKEIDESEITEADANILITLIKQTKTNFLQSGSGNSEMVLSLPSSASCNPIQTKISLGKIAERQTVLSTAYSALDKRLKIEQIGTLKTAGDTMISAVTFYFKDGNQIKDVLETAGKVSLAYDLGDLVNKRFEKKETNPVELISDLPQEMLLTIPQEFSETVLAIDTLASIIRRVNTQSSTKPPLLKPQPIPPENIPIILVEIPTLFLFDVSGSMNDNNKIGQAKTSSLMALQEIQENKRLGRGDSSVSVWAFSGDCSQNAARQILPFTSDLTRAENVLSGGIPRPDGGTPLPQAIERAMHQTSDYLYANPQLNEGRIILLSDGQSTCGEIRPAGVYSQAQTITVKKIRFLTIGFDVAPGSAAERDLQYLASASGGQYFPAQNQQQLVRAFEKTIRVYLPKAIANAQPEFENVTNAIVRRDFQKARQFATEYLQKNPADAFGYYNLAVALEALSRYKGAAENYRKYLQFAPGAADRQEIEARIEKLEQDYRDQFSYYQKLLQSDLDYLKAYYQRLFNRQNNELGSEFSGFVSEKQSFYANLTDILEIRSARIEHDSQDLSRSLGVLNRRVGLQSFDRDAVSLLTIPIGQLEDIIERIENFKAQNLVK